MTSEKIIIVAVDNWVTYPAFEGFEYVLHQYEGTTSAQLPDRVRDAHIICTSATRITTEAILAAPHLRLISTNATGTDNIDKVTAAQRGVSVSHVPAQNTESVTEHAFALYYALRRRILPMHDLTIRGQGWQATGGIHPSMGPPPRTNREETAVVIGYGALGKCVERMASALGMRVVIAERKAAEDCRPGRLPFEDALRQGTVFFQVAPLDASTQHMIGRDELQLMGPRSYLVNVGRGGVVEEAALVQGLREGWIAGAATDVFAEEPATAQNSLLVDPTIPNLILSPHVAWYSQATIHGTLNVVKGNIEGFVSGKPQNLVVDATGMNPAQRRKVVGEKQTPL